MREHIPYSLNGRAKGILVILRHKNSFYINTLKIRKQDIKKTLHNSI